MTGAAEYWATQDERDAQHAALHTPRLYPDGTINHREEALRHLELSEQVGVNSPAGAQVMVTTAQVHATLHAAEVEVESVVLMRSARLHHPDAHVSEHAKHVLRL